MSQTFSEVYGYGNLKDYKGLIGKIKMAFPACYLGIEVEVENVHPEPFPPPSWHMVEDHSLKIYGREFITVPIQSRYLEIELQRLFKSLPNATFSQRTSIHIHMNARDFNKERLESFLCLYVIFEKALFRYSGGRDHNNFCVPVYMDGRAVAIAFDKIRKENFSLSSLSSTGWTKYQALNAVPLWGGDGVKRHGTIEFRHMKGNNSIPTIIGWCNLITSLKLFANNNSVEKIFNDYINTRNESLAKDVFGEYVYLLDIKENDFNQGIAYLKYLR